MSVLNKEPNFVAAEHLARERMTPNGLKLQSSRPPEPSFSCRYRGAHGNRWIARSMNASGERASTSWLPDQGASPLVEGRTPWLLAMGSVREIAAQHLTVPPSSLHERIPAISAAVNQVVLKALAKDPKERFGSVREFAAALEQVK